MVVRRAGVLIAGTGVYLAAVYMTYSYLQRHEELDSFPSPCGKNDDDAMQHDCDNNNMNSTGFSYITNPARNEQYQRIATRYDDCIGRDEFFMGINLLRRSLLYFHAHGTVLEVGAGTGRNLSYYPINKNVQRVALADSSDQMLAQARKKIQDYYQKHSTGSWFGSNRKKPALSFAVIQADASQLEFPNACFDTVVDTFGLCSYDNPVAVLKEMSRVCKPEGKILLLEHGRSHSWNIVTRHLDQDAERHAAKWGCVWNRDLDQILADSNLQIEVLHRFHFGTTYYIVCRPLPPAK